MPQPIPKHKHIRFSFARDAILERPLLAAHVAAIAMHWNEIESRLGIFLAALLEGEARTVIKVFLAIESDGAKRAVIDTITELKLSPDNLTRFREIQKVIGARYSERNKAVHGSWGYSPEYPNDLLWYDPRETVELFPELMASLDESQRDERQALFEKQRESLRVYTLEDIKQIIKRLDCAWKELEEFTNPFVDPLFAKMHTTRAPVNPPPISEGEDTGPNDHQNGS